MRPGSIREKQSKADNAARTVLEGKDDFNEEEGRQLFRDL